MWAEPEGRKLVNITQEKWETLDTGGPIGQSCFQIQPDGIKEVILFLFSA